MSSPVTAVLFDYGMVLSGPPDAEALARLLKVFGLDEATFRAAYWKFRDDYDRGHLGGDAYWHAVAAMLKHSLTADELAELIAADVALWTQPNTPMIAWAEHLRRSGVKTGILSNIGDHMETGILHKFPWLRDFAHHTFSHRLGIAKPDPAIYQHAVQGLATKAENILFIDDREENIVAAHAAGMQAIQYSTQDAFVDEMRAMGHGALLG